MIRKAKPSRNRRRRAPRRRNRKSRIPRSLAVMPQRASIVETVQFQDITPLSMSLRTFSLHDFDRARLISLNFRSVRAAMVEWTYEPLYNVFQDGVASASKPYLYFRMNRSLDKTIPANLADMRAMGATPRAMSSTLKIKYKPNWNSPGLSVYTTSGGLVSRPVQLGQKTEFGWLQNSPYLQTQDSQGAVIVPITARRNPGDLQHQQSGQLTTTGYQQITNWTDFVQYSGHNEIFDQAIQQGGDPDTRIARLTCTVHWEFKDPISTDSVVQTNLYQNPPPEAIADAPAPL